MPLKVQMVQEALIELGKPSTPTEIMRKVMSMNDSEDLGNNLRAKTQAALQNYSLDSKQFKGGRNLFTRSKRGLWDLRSPVIDVEPEPEPEPFITFEGRQLLRHLILERERSTELVQIFKTKLQNFNCIVCGFNFFEVYGALGHGYIEAHHSSPITNGLRESTPSDLEAVCSNCHRMLHRKGLISTHNLRELIQTRRKR